MKFVGMKSLAVFIMGCLLAAYAWGWVRDVHFGQMSTERYTQYYFEEVQDLWDHFLMGVKQAPSLFGKPLPRRHLNFSDRDF